MAAAKSLISWANQGLRHGGAAPESPSLADFQGPALKKPTFFANKSWSDPIRIV